MFGPLGVPELLFILVLALLIFGPRRLPEMGRTLGKAMGEFRRATTELKRSINTEIALEDDDERPRYSRAPRREETGAGGADDEPGTQVTTQGLVMPGTVARGAGGRGAGPEEERPRQGGGDVGEADAAATGAGDPDREDGGEDGGQIEVQRRPAPAGGPPDDEPELPPTPGAGERR
jgi:sec-independent protein translocase protein TatB